VKEKTTEKLIAEADKKLQKAEEPQKAETEDEKLVKRK